MENVKKHTDVIIVATTKKNYLVSESNYHKTIFFFVKFYLGLSILELSKIVMYEFWYDYMKTKIWRKFKIMLHEYRQLYTIHKNRRNLH